MPGRSRHRGARRAPKIEVELAKSLRVGERGAEEISLVDAAEFILEECRMVLPGIQALFGFQLIAVFSARFQSALTANEQRLHMVAIVLIVLSTAMIMTPAAYHLQTGAQIRSSR